MSKLFLTFLVLAIWSLGSTFHYLCNIKEVCIARAEAVTAPIPAQEKTIHIVPDPIKTLPESKTWTAFFAKNSAKKIVDTDLSVLSTEIKSLLQDFPNSTISLNGYTDNKGSITHNQKLSRERAQVLKDALVAKGIAPEKIESASHGALNPIAENDDVDGRSKNRRVEITFNPIQ